MTTDEKYMRRCFQLAQNGRGYVAPNPMVGAVVVYKDKIIGEGYHRQYGQAHAEVNAIKAVKHRSLLQSSTIYVSLEPCSHQGKTPPCAQLIIDSKIPRVVIGCLDPYPEVSGRGVEMLRNAGIEVVIDVLRDKAIALNKEFITAQTQSRPFIYLKWAQSKDGYIDGYRAYDSDEKPVRISNDFSHILVHKMRAQVQGIMVGTNTAIKDNPSLTTRLWYGKNPVRVVIDRTGRIPDNYHLFDGNVETLIFTETTIHENKNNAVTYIPVAFDDNLLPNIFTELCRRKINSIMIEGGSQLLQSLIDIGLWDEALIETGNIVLRRGVKAPVMHTAVTSEHVIINKNSYACKLVNLNSKD